MTQRVMIIDIDLSALDYLEGFFKTKGYQEISRVQSGESAWSMLQNKEFNVVISSWDLYELSGLNLLKIVRRDSRFWDIPFFLTKANFSKEDVILAGQSGVTGLLVSPCDPDNLFTKLDKISEDNSKIEALDASKKLNDGIALLESGDYKQSLEILTDLVTSGENAEAYYNIGYIKSVQEKYSEAVDAFKMATSIDRLYAKAFKALGKVYSRLGNNEMAEKYLQQAADIYLSSENDIDAEDVLKEVIKIKPDTKNAYNSLGVLYRKKGDCDKSLIFYKKALKVQPDGAHVHYNIGKVYLHNKDFKNAKKHMEKALQLNPGYDDLKAILKKLKKL